MAGGGHRFCAGGPYFCLETEGADHFAEEGSLFVLGFGEGYGDVGTEELDGEAGEACSGAEVEEGRAGSEVLSGKEALAEVTADDLLGIADGGEIGSGVPLEEQIEVGGELRVEV